MKLARGFTLIEMLVVAAMMSVLALAALPLADIAQHRSRERELRAALLEIRQALDAYKRLHDAALQGRAAQGSGFPPSLEALEEGWTGLPGAPVAAQRLLRRLPRDPFAPEGVPAAQSWGLRSYASPARAPRPGTDVYDVYSLSERMGSNGIPLAQW